MRDVSESETMLAARGLSFHAGADRLLGPVDVTIREGQRLVIVGANGSGKSLLLRLLHGLIPPSTGELSWRGQPMETHDRSRQAMVFQRPVLLRRTVLANMTFALSAKGIRDQSLAWKALDRARLSHHAHRPARVLSGGEQQRLAVVRAMATEPDLLFLDEPTASLDPASTLAVEDLITAAHDAGVTIVMVTHDVGQARRMGDDVLCLHAGRVAETGPAEKLLFSPQSEALEAWLEGRILVNLVGLESRGAAP
jgi:tungstate transport system ATP-binding protein